MDSYLTNVLNSLNEQELQILLLNVKKALIEHKIKRLSAQQELTIEEYGTHFIQ